MQCLLTFLKDSNYPFPLFFFSLSVVSDLISIFCLCLFWPLSLVLEIFPVPDVVWLTVSEWYSEKLVWSFTCSGVVRPGCMVSLGDCPVAFSLDLISFPKKVSDFLSTSFWGAQFRGKWVTVSLFIVLKKNLIFLFVFFFSNSILALLYRWKNS